MKKISFLVFVLSALLPLSSQARVDSGTPPIAERPGVYVPVDPTTIVMPRPEEVGVDETDPGTETPTGSCELSSEVISAVDFYIRNCLVERDESFSDIDTNLQCTLNATVYRSLCMGVSARSGDTEHPTVETSTPDVSMDAATAAVNACLSTYHCTIAAGSMPPPRTPPPPAGTLAVSAISPSSAQAGGAGFNLQVLGANFTNTSIVLWNGRAKTTSYVSATELSAQMDASDIASAGSVPVTVSTGAVVSTSSVTFTVRAATSTINPDTNPPRTNPPETIIDVPLAPGGNADGGCALGLGSEASMSFSLVMMSFLTGSYLMLRREKKK